MSIVHSVMIIDDDEIHNYLFTKRIRNIGLSDQVHALNKGSEGLQLIQDMLLKDLPLPEIIFLDLQMPVMDGWDFLHNLEEIVPEFHLSRLSLFMLSSSVLPRDIEKAKNHPLIKEYIKKPLMEDELFVIKGRYFRRA